MLDPQTALDLVVAFIDPIVTAWRAPAAVVLLIIVAFRPKHPSRCVMIGRALVLMACVFWIAAAIPALDRAARVGDWLMFVSALASHVCEVFMNWAAVRQAKQAEAPSPFGRMWMAARASRRAPVSE